MSSQIATVAEAVKDALNAEVASSGFSQTFAAIRVYVPLFDLKELGNAIGVRVLGKTYNRTKNSRATTQREIQIDIGIAKRVEQTTIATDETGNTELDDLMLFVEEIADFFGPRYVIAESGEDFSAEWIRSEVIESTPYDITKLREDRQFLSVVRLTFIIH